MSEVPWQTQAACMSEAPWQHSKLSKKNKKNKIMLLLLLLLLIAKPGQEALQGWGVGGGVANQHFWRGVGGKRIEGVPVIKSNLNKYTW